MNGLTNMAQEKNKGILFMLYIRQLLIIGGIIFTIIVHHNALAMEDENNLPTQTNQSENKSIPQFKNLKDAFIFFTSLPPQTTTNNKDSATPHKSHRFLLIESNKRDLDLTMSHEMMQRLFKSLNNQQQ